MNCPYNAYFYSSIVLFIFSIISVFVIRKVERFANTFNRWLLGFNIFSFLVMIGLTIHLVICHSKEKQVNTQTNTQMNEIKYIATISLVVSSIVLYIFLIFFLSAPWLSSEKKRKQEFAKYGIEMEELCRDIPEDQTELRRHFHCE